MIAQVFVDCTKCLALVKSVNIKEHLVLAHGYVYEEDHSGEE